MSRSATSVSSNPSTRWFEWSGSTGQLKYWDKDKQENVFVDLPFTFLILDQLSAVSGYSDDTASGIWSNEVRDLRTELLTVRTKHGIVGKGLYDEVKNIKGARFTKSVYIAYYEGKELKLGHFKVVGSALGAWIEFSKGKNLYNGAVTVAGKTAAKKGTTKYFVPVFEVKESVSEETEEKAKALDRQLQEYLNDYFAVKPADTADDIVLDDADLEPFESKIDDDEIPF
jgi:hypothetical protein